MNQQLEQRDIVDQQRPLTPNTLQVPRSGKGKQHGQQQQQPATKRATMVFKVNKIEAIKIFDDGNELIKSCNLYSKSVLGHQMKSFSTSDLITTELTDSVTYNTSNSVSLLNLCDRINRLEMMSSGQNGMARSDSVWATADPTSQVPSPSRSIIGIDVQTPVFGGAELIRSLNRCTRQRYIKKRLISLHKLSTTISPETDLTQLLKTLSIHNLTLLTPSTIQILPKPLSSGQRSLIVDSKRNGKSQIEELNEFRMNWNKIQKELSDAVTVQDVSNQTGKEMSELERKLFLFNWILVHSDDDNESGSCPSPNPNSLEPTTSSA